MDAKMKGNLFKLPGLLLGLFALCQLPHMQAQQTSPLKIYCSDVDQGCSTLTITPNRKSLLIDRRFWSKEV